VSLRIDESSFLTTNMNFTNTNLDLSQYNVADLVLFVKTAAPQIYVMLARHYKTMNLSEASMPSMSPSLVTKVVNYLNIKARSDYGPSSADLISRTFASSGRFDVLEKVKPVVLTTDDDELANAFCRALDANVAPVSIANTTVVATASTALVATTSTATTTTTAAAAVTIDETKFSFKEITEEVPQTESNLYGKIGRVHYSVPLFMGVPIVTPSMKAALSTQGIDVEAVRRFDVLASQVFTELATSNHKTAIIKPGISSLAPLGKKDLDKALTFVGDMSAAFTFRQDRQRGSNLYSSLYDVMRVTPRTPEYINFVNRWAGWLLAPKKMQFPNLGDKFLQGTYDYSKAYLDLCRNVRGSDDKENTAVGLSGYIEVNVPRSVIKDMSRAFDIIKIMQKKKWNVAHLVGKEATLYVDALAAVGSSYTVIVDFVPSVDWVRNDDSSYSLKHTPLKLLRSGLSVVTENRIYVDLDLVSRTLDKYDGYVRRIATPPVFNTSFMPSCLLHNLTGWIVGADTTIKTSHYAKCANFFILVDKINLARTFPTLLVRPYKLIPPEFSGARLSMTLYTRLMKVAKERGVVAMFSYGSEDLAEALAQAIGNEAFEKCVTLAASETVKHSTRTDILPAIHGLGDNDDDESDDAFGDTLETDYSKI
jgi:hypothetical protein